jgi:phage terminase large subunit-like protein
MPGAIQAAAVRAFSDTLLSANRAAWKPRLLPHQQLPPWDDDWESFVMLAGRGSGKSTAAMYHLNQIASSQVIQGRIIAPTIGDAHECVNGPVGLKVLNPAVRFRINERSVSWPNGSRVLLYGAYTGEDTERLRAGTNSALDIYEEMAAWVRLEEVIDQAGLGLRAGPRPRSITATTPRPREALRRFLARPGTVLRHATTDDNPYTPAAYKDRVHRVFDGSQMGQQELGGILLSAIEGALWNPELVEPDRLREMPLLSRVVVAVDPAKTASNKSDETGIIVVGRGPEPDILRLDGTPPGPDHAFVLADLSGRWSPMEWAEQAFAGARDFGADTIVGETNIAGDLVKSNLANYRQQHDVPAVSVIGSRSRQAKQGRALPVVTLYQQHRVHHVGEPMIGLESQQYEFRGIGPGEKDDRVDALTLGITELDLGWQAVVGRQVRVS